MEVICTSGKMSLCKVHKTPKFRGCQCYKDCNCYEEWKNSEASKPYTSYEVHTGKRIHRFRTLEEANNCFDKIMEQYERNS